MVSCISDTNTGAGGVGTMLEARGQRILHQLWELDSLLTQYASPHGVEKSATESPVALKPMCVKAHC